MVTNSDTIKVATPKDIRQFANPDITLDAVLAMLNQEGFDLGDSVNHMLVHTTVPGSGYGPPVAINCIIAVDAWRDTPKSGSIAASKAYRDAVDHYLTSYEPQYLVLIHRNTIRITEKIFDSKGYGIERLELNL